MGEGENNGDASAGDRWDQSMYPSGENSTSTTGQKGARKVLENQETAQPGSNPSWMITEMNKTQIKVGGLLSVW